MKSDERRRRLQNRRLKPGSKESEEEMCRNGTMARPRWITQGSARRRMHARGIVIGGIVLHFQRRVLSKGRGGRVAGVGDYV